MSMRIHYTYPSPMAEEMRKVEAREAPSDRMYGLVELAQRGHAVDFSDRRFGGRLRRIAPRAKRAVEWFEGQNQKDLRRSDVVVAKDRFSTALTAACRVAGTRIVYLDAMFRIPRRPWKKAATKLNLNSADACVSYSKTQIALWAREYGVPVESFAYLPYCIDAEFYTPSIATAGRRARPYVLSVGRDLGRSFDTVVGAMDGLGLDLKLVTLPYLLRGVDTSPPAVEVLQHVPYARLFELYAEALAVVIPLKQDIAYPSGIRGLLEGLALGKAVISSRTDVLEEYAAEGEGVIYVEAGRVDHMRDAITRVRDDYVLRSALEARGPSVVKERFDMPVFVSGLERILRQVVGAA